MKPLITLVSLVLILAGVNWSIAQKEAQLANGDIAYLKLKPVDPRSIMQGDFMRLRFQVGDDIYNALPKTTSTERLWRPGRTVAAQDGYVIVKLNDKNIATYKRLYQKDQTLQQNELKMRYRIRNNRVKFATNAFFFQEGTAKSYQKAQYGQFRVAKNGELLLVDLYDKDLHKLGSKKDIK